jgi:competence ComEA-like helix-hairpin-helix protein
MFTSVAMVGLFVTSVSTRALQDGTKPSSETPDMAAAAAAEAAADEKAGAMFAASCIDCHDLETATAMRRMPRDWEFVVADMGARGANVTPESSAVIAKYLARHYGLLNVNRATAPEIALVLWLSEKDAAAIVAYRTANGPFADFDALTKVPGIDLPKLTAARDFVLYRD